MNKKGEALLSRMKASKSGWKREDLDRLYRYFGFERIDSGHILYVHPEFPHLRGTVTHSSSFLPIGYITHAINTVERLKTLKGASDEES